ncbi:Clp protease N-terminal domain-containing protein [Modestobacter sp. URMC 112]
MFERFTQEAREVVVAAQEEARALRAEEVAPVHLLLAVSAGAGRGGEALRSAGIDHEQLRTAAAGGDDGLDADALAAFGVDLAQVRAAAEEAFGPGALAPGEPSGRLRFAAGSKKSLEEALRHVLTRRSRRRERTIDSGCILVGVLAVGDPVVTRVLQQLGTDPEVLREQAAHAA